MSESTKTIPFKMVTDILDVNGVYDLHDVLSIVIDIKGVTITQIARDEEGKRFLINNEEIATNTQTYKLGDPE